ncbi:hypothetical protein TNCV_3381271 [Trichonephila clavipes]|nr:hypothetical protein TNCV_3381271 [Trichonephila clavipes]
MGVSNSVISRLKKAAEGGNALQKYVPGSGTLEAIHELSNSHRLNLNASKSTSCFLCKNSHRAQKPSEVVLCEADIIPLTTTFKINSFR